MADNLYEAMFLVDSAKGGSEFPEIIRHIANILERAGAEIERIEQWDERKLAYRIKRAKRGIYILVYFRAPGTAVSEIRHDVQLSEQLLRVLILRTDEPDPVHGELYNTEGEVIQEAAPRPASSGEEDEEEEEQEEEEDEEEAEEAVETADQD
ncbi:MAG: 30S ribosomal protein S6 [Candidatus Brocadiia bacterium]